MRVSFAFGIALLTFSAVHSGAAQDSQKAETAVPASQTFALVDTRDLVVAPGVKAEAVEYRGRKAVRLTKDAADEAALAFVNGTQFRDGTIEVDLATKLVRPPGVRRPGFTGIAFRARDDRMHYELFYLRPGNATEDDQAKRNHSVQYTSEPDFGWEKLRRNWPFIYESYADLQTDEWTKLKIEVHGRQARLYLNGSEKPSLIVDGLKGEDLEGVALMTERLDVHAEHRVLEVGTGSGYQTAILAELLPLGSTIRTLEIVPDLSLRAERTLRELGYDNVRFRVDDGAKGWPEAAPYDAILVAAAPDEVPAALLEQLAPGGRLVIPVGPDPEHQELQLWRKLPGTGSLVRKVLMHVRFVPLTGPANLH